MRWFHTAIIVVLGAAILVFVVQNLQSATIAFLGLSLSVPLALLVIIIYALGMITGGSVWSLLRRTWLRARGTSS